MASTEARPNHTGDGERGETGEGLERGDRHPVCLIRQEGDKLVICDEGAAELASISTPLAVISIAGLYRTGKSFLLNKLAGRSGGGESGVSGMSGFPVGSSTEACTRGIWVWAQPHLRLPSCPEATVVFMDTEGLASLDQDETYDAQVFALGLLLSSFFVLNSMGVIDEAAIDRLFLVTEVSKIICVASGPAQGQGQGQGSEEDDLSTFFPPLMWLLRDFVLTLEADGEEVSRGAYLERALCTQADDKGRRRVAERNEIRGAITSLFKHRQCMTLVRPAVDEAQVRNASSLRDDQLRPEFREQMEAVRTAIFSSAPCKTLFGRRLDGPMLVSLARAYLDTLASGQVPSIKGAWATVQMDRCTAAHEQALCLLREWQKDTEARHPPIEREEFFKELQDIRKRVLGVYHTATRGLVGGGGGGGEGGGQTQAQQHAHACLSKLEAELGECGERCYAAIYASSLAACTSLLEGLSKDILRAVRAGEVEAWPLLQDRMEALLDNYRAEARGPAKSACLAGGWEDLLLPCARLLWEQTKEEGLGRERSMQGVQAKLEAAVEAMQREATAKQQTLTLLETSQEELRASLATERGEREQTKEKLASVEEELHACDVTLAKAEGRLEEAAKELTHERQESKALITAIEDKGAYELRDYEQRLERVTADCKRAQGDLTKMEAAVAERMAEAREQRAQQTREMTKLSRTLNSERDKRHTLKAEAKGREGREAKLVAQLEAQQQQQQGMVVAMQAHASNLNDYWDVRLCVSDLVAQVEMVALRDSLGFLLAHNSELVEEKGVYHAKLQDYMLKITSLPDFYQRQIFCATEQSPDLFEALT